MLVIEDPESGSTLLEVSRVIKQSFVILNFLIVNPIVVQFWKDCGKGRGQRRLPALLPYITSNLMFLANEIMRPIIAQEKSSFNLRNYG